MLTIDSDVAVLGAGIVGVSTALHLQARGRSVVLVDRRGPGEETSYGNAGLIERSSVVPYAFPRSVLTLLRFALNRSADVRYHWTHLPRVAPWLFQYWRHSSPRHLADAARDMLPLIERCVSEHQLLLKDAEATHLARETGWLELCRTPKDLAFSREAAERLGEYGLSYDLLDRSQLHDLEPAINPSVFGAIHWRDPVTVSSPGAVTKAYAELFLRRGGRFVHADARQVKQSDGHWKLPSEAGEVRARDVVLALGAWSTDVTEQLGYRIPLAVKRGYHMHFSPPAGVSLNRPILSEYGGFVLSPMLDGIRLTTGIELAPRDSAPTPVQLDKAEAIARSLIPLGNRVEPEAWMGVRPCLPDMKPVIGGAGKHPGLWFNFGHAHHGFTLGPVTGRLLAEQMTGETPAADLLPYRACRF
ncbi:FAD-dependent oxidoreductase [Mesorhizobium sp. KR1-2]|uniref:NAD(P)/FAD-dependent oxidoreductase n=1 Tax=Mesorhizobium sp. KR1-2 TaxID=3156609 RepID=UPI0032B588C3